MTIETLKNNLEETGNTNVESVLFDFFQIINTELDKSYPLVLWDLDNSSWKKKRSDGTQNVTMDVFIVDTFDENQDEKIKSWDLIESIFDDYLALVGSNSHITIVNDEVDKELYPPGIISVDGEIGIRFRVELKLWC